MSETNAEILKRIIANAKGCNDDNGYFADVVQLDVNDYAHLIEQADRAQELEEYCKTIEKDKSFFYGRTLVLQDENKQLRANYKELVIQENAMQNNWKLAFFSAEKYKKCLDDITVAMNTERPAEEKTKDLRRILEGLK